MDYRVLYVGTQAIFGLLFLALFYLRHTSERSEDYDKLDVLYGLFLVTIVLDMIWVFIDGVPAYRLWHIAHQTLYLCALSLTGYTWFLYTLDALPTQAMALRKYRFVLGIPVFVILVLTLSSAKTGLMFTINEAGQYIRGPLQPFAVMITFCYLVMGSLVALYCRKQALFTMDKRRFGVIALFPLPVLILSTIQFLLPPGLPAATGGALISLLLIFGTSQNALITRDYLTGLPNRYSFEQKLIERMGRYKADGFEHLYLIEGDLDKFKHINDAYGHLVGDEALKETARLLSEYFSSLDATVFRTGGDEFMVIVESHKPLDVSSVRSQLDQVFREARTQDGVGLSMSLGFEECTETGNFREFVEKVDMSLYEAKNARA